MKIEELRSKTEKDLLKELNGAVAAVEKSVSDLLQGKSKDTSKTKRLRREVARIKTVLLEKKILAEMKVGSLEEKDA